MKKVLYILSMLLLAASCEIPFQLEQNGQPRIYLQGIVNNGEVFVSAQVANPVSGKQLEEVPLNVRTSLDGDRFSVEVSADGVGMVSGSTTVPPLPDVVDLSARTFDIDTLHVTAVTFELDHAPGEDEYYGIRIRRDQHLVFADGTEKDTTSFATPGYLLTLIETGKFDLEDFMQVGFDGQFLGGPEYQALTMVTKKQFQGNKYQFYLGSFDARLLDGIRGAMPEGDTGVAGGGITSGEVGDQKDKKDDKKEKIEPVETHTEYTFTFYRLSEEFFYFAKAMFQSNFDFLSNMGLIPANFTWSNVKGGLGFVGAVSGITMGPYCFDPEEEADEESDENFGKEN